MKNSTTDIWARVVTGDPDAWEQLVFKYSPLVYAIARRSGLDSADAEDCAQQVWLALYKGRLRLNDPAKLVGWLSSTSRRQAIRIRNKRRRTFDPHELKNDSVEPDQPDEEIIRLQQQARLNYALEQLDERCRLLLNEMFLSADNVTYRELAEKLRIPFNSLGPTRARCLKKLYKIITNLE